MEEGFFTRHRKTLVSSGILLVIALHAVPVAYPQAQLWPIMHWGLYRFSKSPGPIFTQVRKVFATSVSGKTEAITPQYSGLSIHVLDKSYFRPMAAGDSAAPARLLAMLNQHRKEDPFIEIRLEIARYTVTDSGIVRQDKPVISYRHDPDSNGGNAP